MTTSYSCQHGWIHVFLSDGRPIQKGSPSLFRGHRMETAAGEELGGVYSMWNWDGRALEVKTCETGFKPVFYYMSDNEVIVATRLHDLFERGGLAPTLDQRALAVFLRLGFFIGNATPFQGVRVLGPSGRIFWSPDKHVVNDEYPSHEPTSRSVNEAIDTYVEVFRSAMSHVADDLVPRCAVPLSGGRDSRHIALELYRRGIAPRFAVTAFHRPPRSNEDIRIAKLLCKQLGWPHLSAKQPVDWFGQEVRHLNDVEHLSFEHAWTLPIRDKLVENRIEFAFDGVGGDVLSAGLFQDDAAVELYEKRRLDELAMALISRWAMLGGDDGLAETCGPELADVVKKETAIDALREELARHVDQPNPLKSFYFWNRTRRGTSLFPFKILDGVTMFAPFLAPEVRNFLLTLPHSFTADTTFHTRAISRADERIGTIPYEDKLATNTGPSALHGRLYSARMLTACLVDARNAFWRPRFVLPRVLRALASGNLHTTWWKPRRVIYLMSLSRVLGS